MLNSDSSRPKFARASPSFGRGLGAVVSCAAVLCSNGLVLGQTCGTQGQFCPFGTGCDDGDPCNGTETCSPPGIIRVCRCDPTPPCDDGNACTQDVCRIILGRISCSHPPVVCDDGLFCNGEECCCGEDLFCSVGERCPGGVEGQCSTFNGSPPCFGRRFCDEVNDRCVDCLTDADCDYARWACFIAACDNVTGQCNYQPCDDLFCDGRVLCDSVYDCFPGIAPCASPELCDEANDRCAECLRDADCADDDPCSVEACDPNRLACRADPCNLGFDAPADGTVFPIGKLIDVVGRGPRGLDVVLVLDESESIDATEFTALKSFSVSMVQGLLPLVSTGIEAKFGVTTFSGGSRRILDLTFNRQEATDAINALTKLDWGDNFSAGEDTCIGCGIDDASANLILHGRKGASQVMIVITDGFNILPQFQFASHLAGALEAAAFHKQVIFAVGIGESVFPSQLDQIASDVPNVQTRFTINDFTALQTILGSLFTTLGAVNAYTVDIELPDGSQPPTVVDENGVFTLRPWSTLRGENIFTARTNTFVGPKTASLTLIGVYPCANRCGDLTGDGAVDLRDVAVFQNCFGDPSYSSTACACSDLNGDTRIDLFDHAALVSALQSPTKNAPPDCPAP